MDDIRISVIVIGGGASGMMAAIAAAEKGCNVIVLERMSRVGKKLLATGNGRCNLTNMNIDENNYHGSSGKFAINVIKQFDVDKTLSFFRELGLETLEEEEGRVFPVTNQASSVLDLLRYEMDRLNVAEIGDSRVNVIEKDKHRFVCFCTNGQRYYADRIVIATGGKSCPNLGSNGGGYSLAKSLGHHIIDPAPALVQVNCDSPYLKSLQGIKVNAKAQICVSGTVAKEAFGEVLFTDYGLSGPPVLDLSRTVSLQEDPRMSTIRLNLFPDRTEKELEEIVASRFVARPEKTLWFSFVGLLNKRLISAVLKESGIEDANRGADTITQEETRRIVKTLQNFTFVCSGTQNWMHSQVTAGGIDIKEIDRRTLESRKVPGVFFAGEVIDVDGDSGGYNLQWAWSSGYVAGSAAGDMG